MSEPEVVETIYGKFSKFEIVKASSILGKSEALHSQGWSRALRIVQQS